MDSPRPHCCNCLVFRPAPAPAPPPPHPTPPRPVQVVPWWAMLLFAALVYLDASLRTLPTYSLAVQMGSDFKHRERPSCLQLPVFC